MARTVDATSTERQIFAVLRGLCLNDMGPVFGDFGVIWLILY